MNIRNIENDIFIVVYKHLCLDDTYKMMLTCKDFSDVPDNIWGILCDIYYPREFWIKALQRSPSISKPIGTNKGELERLKKFEKDVPDWKLTDYYKLWETYEQQR